jgi:Flp pilus assembly protein TadD
LGEARRALETAAQLYQGDPQVFEELGQVLRREGDCASALLAFQRALAIDSTRAVAQSRLSACRRELAPR